MTTETASETMAFGADVSRLLEIVTHALYSNRDVFLRELVSNAADACDRLRFDSVSDPSLIRDQADFAIHITKDTAARTLTIRDNGIGMTRAELVDHLGTIAKSGTKALLDRIKAQQGAELSLIGQFGVGFYASFMVASKATVISRRAGTNETWVWESTGQDQFSIREASGAEKEIAGLRGTAVILTIKDEASDYLVDDKIRQIIETYSNHISIPVTLEGVQVNAASALWARPKSAVSAEEYADFYRSVAGGMMFDAPLMTSHWRAEGKIEYTGLLFVPGSKPWDLYDPTRRHAIRLYVRRIFIADDCAGLMYPWLRFMRGVIDSEDLPLNISREMLQHNAIVSKIRSGVAKKILSDLDRLSREDTESFNTVWNQFGAVIKEGLYDAAEHREDLFKICRFHTTAGEEQISIATYLDRAKEGQKQIFFITGDNIDSLRGSPHLEGFRARGIEVLMMKDTIDEFWLGAVQDYQGHVFTSVTKGSIDLSPFPVQDEKSKESNEVQTAIEPLIAYLRQRLSSQVSDVRVSSRLTDSPVCLVASDKEVDMHMQRVLRIHQQYEAKHGPILEINRDHPLIQGLAALATSADSPALADAADLLVDQAKIIQGETVADPAGFARRLASFMQRGIAA